MLRKKQIFGNKNGETQQTITISITQQIGAVTYFLLQTRSNQWLGGGGAASRY